MHRAIELAGVIAIIRSARELDVPPIVDAIVDGGVSLVELTLTTPGALAAVAALHQRRPAAALGVGSVRDPGQARAAIEAGAAFLVTPTVDLDVLHTAAAAGVPVVCGALTPTEVDTAARGGAAAVKVFPAGALGGPSYLRELRAPMPELRLVPTGGVSAANIAAYRAAGAAGVGVGSALFSDALFSDALFSDAGTGIAAAAALRELRTRSAALAAAWAGAG